MEFVASDITLFKPNKKFKLWHERATFHFLTQPEKCSGLSITQYSQDDLKSLFARYFKNIKCFEDTHTTPWNTIQNFVYCGFKRVQEST